MQSLERSSDEELLGSFAGISASLISFCRSTELPVYIAIAEALESMDDIEDLLSSEVEVPTPLSILHVGEVAARTLGTPPPPMVLTPSLPTWIKDMQWWRSRASGLGMGITPRIPSH